MKIFNKVPFALFLLTVFLLSLLTGCDAGKPEDSVNIMGSDRNGNVLYCVGLTEENVSVWYTDGSKKDRTETPLPAPVSNLIQAKDGLRGVDINFDGCTDLVFPREKTENLEYSYVLLNNGDNSFSVCEVLKDIPNLGFDNGDIYADSDLGLFGIRRTVYRIAEDGGLIIGSEYTLNVFDVVKNLMKEKTGYGGVRVEHPEMDETRGIVYGRISVDGIYCNVYTVYYNEKLSALFALSDEGTWFFDNGATGTFSRLN